MWLVVKGKIQCRANLFRKHAVDSPGCTICGSPEETTEHLLFQCTKAAEFWEVLGVPVPQNGFAAYDIHSSIKVSAVPQQQHNMFIALCCWQLLKRRNGAVFQDEMTSLRQLLIACSTEAKLWKARLPRRQKSIADIWCARFQEAIQRTV